MSGGSAYVCWRDGTFRSARRMRLKARVVLSTFPLRPDSQPARAAKEDSTPSPPPPSQNEPKQPNLISSRGLFSPIPFNINNLNG